MRKESKKQLPKKLKGISFKVDLATQDPARLILSLNPARKSTFLILLRE